MILNTVTGPVDTEKAIAHARSLIGTPFVHQGRNPALGLDCIGLVLETLRAGGWKPLYPKTALYHGYAPLPDSDALVAAITNEADRLGPGVDDALANCQPLDLLLMQYRTETRPRHLALITGRDESGPLMIHTNSNERAVAEHHVTMNFRILTTGVYRLKIIH